MVLTASVTVAREGRYVAVIRGVLGSLLDGAEAPGDVVDELQVAVAEACANVVRHAEGSDAYRVDLRVANEQCVVEVLDFGPGFAPGEAGGTEPDPEEESGRGLALMRALTDEVAFDHVDSAMRVRLSRVW